MIKCVMLLLAVGPALLADESPVKVSVLETNLLCIQASRVTDNFSARIRAAQPTNKISGIVLDLRFADGNTVADTDYFSENLGPLVILVNSQTRGSAAGLAAQLRASGKVIVIGGTNAPATLQPDIAVAVGVAEEKKFQENPFAAATPNVAGSLSATNDLLPFVDHMSEAELVRKRIKDGDDDGLAPVLRAEPPPVIRDPELARAVDLLKALAVLNKPRG